MKKTDLTLLIVDWIAAIVSWFLFFSYRKRVEEPDILLDQIVEDDRLLLGLLVIPTVWILLWAFLGLYRRVLQLSLIHISEPTRPY